MALTRCAVIGTGHQGRFHARKYAALANAELVAVVDTNPHTAAAVAAECDCTALLDYQPLLGDVDAVSIAVPTVQHLAVASDFLKCGTHVLLEKPMATTVAEAEVLNRLALKSGVILQVGHLERFNAAVTELSGLLVQPMFIEAHRLAPYRPRSTDVCVVLDLMIHDIDIILNLVRAPVRAISGNGAKVLSNSVDIANARIEFANGCVANITASRVSQKTQRKMRIFQENAYLSVDFQEKKLSAFRLGDKEIYPGVPTINKEETCFADNDPLMAEIQAFLDSIQNGSPVLVSGEDGQKALETATHISDMVLQPVMQMLR